MLIPTHLPTPPTQPRCSLEDVEQALTLGLIRVGVQLGGFKKKPVRKGYITCQDMLEVLPFDEHYDHTDHHIDVRACVG